MITIGGKGDYSKATKYLNEVMNVVSLSFLDKYGREGVAALSAATPVRSGKTSGSWSYQISRSGDVTTIDFLNNNVNKGVNIAIILQTGHGTGTGGYVAGRDYINPAIQPVFDRMVEEAWKEVTKL